MNGKHEVGPNLLARESILFSRPFLSRQKCHFAHAVSYLKKLDIYSICHS
jgi:hypothetical protein